MVDEHHLARAVALVLPVELRHGHVRLVEDDQVVVGEVVEQRVRHLPRRASVEVARVVLDARAHPDLAQHLEVVRGAHPEALRLEQLLLALELGEAVPELVLDAGDGLLQAGARRDVVRRGEQDEPLELTDDLTGHRVDLDDAFDLVAEQLEPHRVLLVRGVHLDRVAAHPELVAREREVVALVLQLDEAGEDRALLALLPLVDDEALPLVLVGSTEPIDRGDRGDDDHVAAAHDRRGGGVSEPVDLVVDRRVLLDVRVARRQVRLGLVVVVVGDEVLDAVLGEELAQLARDLCGERLVGREQDRRLLHLRDHAGDRERLARARDAEERLVPLSGLDALGQTRDRVRLVTGRGELGDQLELRHDPL